MGVQPPQDDLDGGPDAVDFGIAALEPHLDRAGVTYPVAAEDLVESLGDPSIDLDPSGNAVALSTVVERADRERFESRTDLMDALHPEFERLRREAGSGVVGWLRSLVPGA